VDFAKTAEVVWYATGRFYANGSTLFDVGYFLHVQGIAHDLFTGRISEETALLTFSAEPFTAPPIDNGGLSIGIDPRGVFRLYLRESGGATFDDPATFAVGQCVGTFERVSMVPTVKVGISSTDAVLMNVFTARLVSSEPFVLGSVTYDLRDIVGSGITQWGTAATEPLTPPPGYSAAVPFVGSAIRTG
jgi:hypothetical protein